MLLRCLQHGLCEKAAGGEDPRGLRPQPHDREASAPFAVLLNPIFLYKTSQLQKVHVRNIANTKHSNDNMY